MKKREKEEERNTGIEKRESEIETGQTGQTRDKSEREKGRKREREREKRNSTHINGYRRFTPQEYRYCRGAPPL
jgi:hypothetical protein